jgi:hypothetical protein
MHRDRLAAIREAGAAIGEGKGVALRGLRGRDGGRSQRIEAQRLDPQPRRIDDLEHDRVRLRHLAGDRCAVCDHSIDRRDERFRLPPHLVERRAPILEALQLQPCLVELDAGHRATLGQRFIAVDAPLDDRDLLVKLALPLTHVGDVDRLQWRRHIGEHVASVYACAKAWKAAGRRRQSSARRCLHKAARTRVRDDAARQLDRALKAPIRRHRGADRENTLRCLGNEHAAVGQALGKVATDRL